MIAKLRYYVHFVNKPTSKIRGNVMKSSLSASCVFFSARCSQDKFDHCSCSQKRRSARVLTNPRKDHSIPLKLKSPNQKWIFKAVKSLFENPNNHFRISSLTIPPPPSPIILMKWKTL